MTDQKLPPSGNKGQFKQLYKKNCGNKPFTDARIGYDDYLHTDVWRDLRASRLIRDLHRCARCGSGINVEVHHIRYPDVWGMESADDLVTLCDKCHAVTHKYDNQGGVKV